MRRKEKKNRVDFKKILLGVIGVAGVVSVSLVAPNALQMLESLGFIEGPRSRRRKYYLTQGYERLMRQGLVSQSRNRYGREVVTLTPKGKRALTHYQIDGLAIQRPKKWDGKWRMIIFDIQEHKRSVRDELRRNLHRLGFVCVQQSVWVYPFECRDIFEILRVHCNLGKRALYGVLHSLENDYWLRKKFGL
jgi:DNA-binding transcriptional regulator PaaX